MSAPDQEAQEKKPDDPQSLAAVAHIKTVHEPSLNQRRRARAPRRLSFASKRISTPSTKPSLPTDLPTNLRLPPLQGTSPRHGSL